MDYPLIPMPSYCCFAVSPRLSSPRLLFPASPCLSASASQKMKHHNQTVPIFDATEDYLKTTLLKAKKQFKEENASEKASLGKVEGVKDALKVQKPHGDAPINASINAPTNASITELQVRIIDQIVQNPFISYEVLAEKLNKNRTTVMRNIQKLKESGILKRVGPKKSGYWEVNG